MIDVSFPSDTSEYPCADAKVVSTDTYIKATMHLSDNLMYNREYYELICKDTQEPQKEQYQQLLFTI